MTEIELLIDLHLDGERQGPGGKAITLEALKATGLIGESNLRIADIGCGTGASAMLLAEELDGQVNAIDLFPEFLDRLTIEAAQNRLIDKIVTKVMSMNDLKIEPRSLDLIWSEGAIYNIGFANGAKYWHQFLKSDGILAISDISWLTDERPTKIEEYWQSFYPEIDTVKNKIAVLEKQGYEVLRSFILPESCWEEEYYQPLEKRYKAFLERHENNKAAHLLVKADREEISMYRKYKAYYSYAFYIARNR